MFLSIFLHRPEYTTFGVTVDHWRDHVHDQNRVEDPFREAPTPADQKGEQPQSQSVDDSAMLCNGAADPVGGHVEGAKHQPSSQHVVGGMPQGICAPVKDEHQDKHSADVKHGDLPVDVIFVDQVDASKQQGCSAGLTQGAGDVSKKQCRQGRHIGHQGAEPVPRHGGCRGGEHSTTCILGQQRQGSGRGDPVKGADPAGHGHRPGGSDHSPADQGRIKQIVPQPSEQLFSNDNG